MFDSISVVIPTYNESARLPRTLDEILPYLESHFRQYEVIVVDDASPDGTGAIVEQYRARNPRICHLRQPRRIGKGAALRRGCLEARLAYVLYMDADHATRIQELDVFMPHLVGGDADVVA